MKLKIKQKAINGGVWYVWLGDRKVDTIRRTTSSSGGQQTFKIESIPGQSFPSIKDCSKALEAKYATA